VFLVQILEWQIDLLNNPASSFNPANIYTKTISLILFDNVLSNTDQTLREALGSAMINLTQHKIVIFHSCVG
jgi:hypothetical protein